MILHFEATVITLLNGFQLGKETGEWEIFYNNKKELSDY